MKDNWFSNFKPLDVPIIHDNISYPTIEHFYQAMKTLDDEWREEIANRSTPSQARILGKKAPIRPDWDKLKLKVMKFALKQKFTPSTTWYKKLMNHSGEIVEYNYWHDNFWGHCTCRKCTNKNHLNHLGKLLMNLKGELLTK
jgi:ribA/ribD-fused uncharacterized protein